MDLLCFVYIPSPQLSHLAAAVAVATALHRAVHAAEAGEAETPALDAAALT